MKRLKKRLIILACCIVTLIVVLSVQASAYTYPSMPSNWQNLTVTIGGVSIPLSEYPDGSYWSPEKSTMTVQEARAYGLSLSSDLNLRGWQCLGFGRYVYAALFYKYPQNASIDTHLGYSYGTSYAYTNVIENVLGQRVLAPGYSPATLKQVITACKPGALMRISGHTMMVMAIFDDGLIIYDANFASDNEVDVRMYTWETFVTKLGSRGIEALHMPSYHPGYTYSTGNISYPIDPSTAGTYKVVVNSIPLNVRSIPSTSGSIVATLENGTIVNVIGNYGTWYAFKLNGVTVWASSAYLQPYSPSSSVTVSFDANGGSCSVSYKDYTPGGLFGTLPTPTKTDRNFIGWFDGDTQYTASSVVPTTSVTLTAKWGILTYTDVYEDDWYATVVEKGNRYGLIASDTRFRPADECKRCEFVAVLARLYQTTTGKTISGSPSKFVDVPSSAYYYDAVCWAYDNNLISGYPDNRFGPNDPITREQIAALMNRYAEFMHYTSTYNGGSLIGRFSDASRVSPWAENNLNWAIYYGLFYGDDHNRLNPLSNTYRSEMIALAVRFVEKFAR